MRRQYFSWIWLVTALVLTIYGGYSIISSLRQAKNVPTLGLVFFIVGATLLAIFLVLLLISYFQKKKEKPVIEEPKPEPKEEPKPEPKEEVVAETAKEETPADEPPSVDEPEVEEAPEEPVVHEEADPDIEAAFVVGYDHTSYERTAPTRGGFRGGSGYVRKFGYGPVLRVTDEEILDMRSNTYYRIEGNMVKQSGGGPVFEISGNRIRSAFGGYLYEISGDTVNKVFGGYYASFSGSILQTYDLSEKFEVPGSLNLQQKLAVVALLLGTC